MLRAHGDLRALDDDEVRLLADAAQVKQCPKGSYVFRESQPRRAFGVLVRGRIQIIKGLRALRDKRASLPTKKHGNIPL